MQKDESQTPSQIRILWSTITAAKLAIFFMNLQYPINQTSDSTKEVNLLLSIYCHNKQITGSYNVLGLFLFLHSKFFCWILKQLKLNC